MRRGIRTNLLLLEDSNSHTKEYNKILDEIQTWPSWKINIYNEHIATSAHARKIRKESDINGWYESWKKNYYK